MVKLAFYQTILEPVLLVNYKAWKLLVSSKDSYGIILEDDVELSDEFRDLLCSKSWIPKGADLIKLEKFLPTKISKILIGKSLTQALGETRHVHKMYSRHTGAAAYLLSVNGANRLLKCKTKYTVPVDHLLFNENSFKAMYVTGANDINTSNCLAVCRSWPRF